MLGSTSKQTTTNYGILSTIGDFLVDAAGDYLAGRGGEAPAGAPCPPGQTFSGVSATGCAPLALPSGGSGPCPPGTTRVGSSCVDFSAALPGGAPFTQPAAANGGGVAVMGAFGIPAMRPDIVGMMLDGTAIRRCVAGAVLGRDDLCYLKGSIPRAFRKWAPRSKPPVSAYDAKMMRKYGPGGSKQKKIKGLAQNAGFSCKKK